MKLNWQIDPNDVQRIKAFVDGQIDNPLVRSRITKNLADTKPAITKNDFWAWMVRMRLTSVQKSGPNSPVAKFNRSEPFPLSYEHICGAKHAKRFIADVLKNARGIRFTNKIPRELAANFELLQSGEWTRALNECNRLSRSVPQAVEREIARYIDDKFEGFGPKQSRNLLQALGLTRFEIPIDSRVTQWLNKFGFPVHLTASALADRHYYEFVSDGIQALCEDSGVYPCVLDAAIFASKDRNEWTDEAVY